MLPAQQTSVTHWMRHNRRSSGTAGCGWQLIGNVTEAAAEYSSPCASRAPCVAEGVARLCSGGAGHADAGVPQRRAYHFCGPGAVVPVLHASI